MTEITNKYRELEIRTTEFGKQMVRLCTALPKNRINDVFISQSIRSAGSVGANYREANEATGEKDFVYRLRIARKECKETEHWLSLIQEANPEYSKQIKDVCRECLELRSILSAIILKARK